MIYADSFTPFYGVVESYDDPLKVGRLQVRVVGYHTDNKEKIPTDYLQWFSVVVNNSESLNGKGKSPTGYDIGSTVFGYFVSKDHQSGMIVGSLVGITNEIPDTNPLAIGETEHPLVEKRQTNRITGITKGSAGGEWEEPDYKNESVYPFNDVTETKAGHVKEYDNTEGKERIHEFHTVGSYTEIDEQGNRVVRVVGDGYEIIAGEKNVYVIGDVNMTVDGNLNQYVKGNYMLQVDGDKSEVVKGSNKAHYQGEHKVLSGGDIGLDGSRIDLNSGSASGNSSLPRS